MRRLSSKASKERGKHDYKDQLDIQLMDEDTEAFHAFRRKEKKLTGLSFLLINIHCIQYEYAMGIMIAVFLDCLVTCLLICVVNILQIAAHPGQNHLLRSFFFYLQTTEL